MTQPKLFLDTFSEVYDLLKPWATGEFWDLESLEIVDQGVYVLSRHRFIEHQVLIRQLIQQGRAKFIMCNPHEGSDTVKQHCQKYQVDDLVRSKQLLLIAGGDMQADWPCLRYDKFLTVIFDHPENVQAAQRMHEIFETPNKPYKFLFLNGRGRAHRRYLIEKFKRLGLLDQSLWTNLSSSITVPSREIALMENEINVLYTPIDNKILPSHYEVDRYQQFQSKFSTKGNIKLDIFNNEWGEIYLQPAAYIDTYFSMVTETVFEYPYSFRTEKIAKPLAMGHPFVVAANRGFYRDLKNLGFKTFDHLIDESFDLIDNSQARIDRIITIVNDLCQQDLNKFLSETRAVCEHNQQHLMTFKNQEQQQFIKQFFEFIK
jgi:hypothetical protein